MFETLTLAAIEWQFVLGSTWLEIIATVSAILGVILIARQNILGWPLGIVWAAISAWLCFTQWQLVSDGILYLIYIPIQIYCWVQWKMGDSESGAPLHPTWMPAKKQGILVACALGSIVLWAFGISAMARNVSWIPEPALLWRDSTTTVLNFFAQFLQARKRMENWVLWLVVNCLGIHIYWVKDAPIYSVQYGFFLILGIYGWVEWHRSRKQLQEGK
ncbi:nicotinamide riboside transporter PnuC [Sulfuriroseicoccus oceanibius]|uniref:Nicotinamide riboside transporter PnuC n=1 Tax=Sulfuriroseicoccus oceanibius TaxID=2707525 RepID=A0A6B3LBU3_9BACT|nr:nicotinamide riboside transporter PnuC [Sulfuriroseicoccus oceanibius]QQL46124.1 nicotinamide mononucleotide transporter [Sulfuriroseicoccus oceanibius]